MAAKGGSNTGLYILIGVVAVAAIAGGAYVLWSGDDESPVQAPVVDTAPPPVEEPVEPVTRTRRTDRGGAEGDTDIARSEGRTRAPEATATREEGRPKKPKPEAKPGVLGVHFD